MNVCSDGHNARCASWIQRLQPFFQVCLIDECAALISIYFGTRRRFLNYVSRENVPNRTWEPRSCVCDTHHLGSSRFDSWATHTLPFCNILDRVCCHRCTKSNPCFCQSGSVITIGYYSYDCVPGTCYSVMEELERQYRNIGSFLSRIMRVASKAKAAWWMLACRLRARNEEPIDSIRRTSREGIKKDGLSGCLTRLLQKSRCRSPKSPTRGPIG
mmetsp:Transcript_51554/g.55794  ORF Transcript_51554/g.55794 Transcript_51554/m.55794 type:complete len:215 (+) Transcript_51554:291-935(+)